MAETTINVVLNADEFKKKAADIKKSTQGIEDSFSNIAKKSGVAFAAIAGGIAGVVREAAKVETVKTQFAVLTGSVETATAAVKQLQDFSSKTPFQFGDVARAGKTLLAFGVNVNDVQETLRKVGDVAAVSGKDLSELATIFGQVKAQGKLTGERLNQLAESGINVGPALAKGMGVAESSIRDLVSKGQVDFATFEKAFSSLSAEGGIAFGGMEKQSLTLEGQISTLKDNFSLLAVAIGEQFLPYIKMGTEFVTEFLQKIRSDPALAEMIAKVLAVGAAVTGAIAILATGALVFTKVATAVRLAGLALSFLGKGLIALTGPVGIVVAVVAGLAVLIATHFDEITIVFQNFKERAFEIFGGLANLLIGVFTLDLEMIKAGFESAKGAVVESIAASSEEISAMNAEIRGQDPNGLNPTELSMTPNAEKVGAEFAKTAEVVDKAQMDAIAREREIAEIKEEIDKERLAAKREADKQFLKDEEQFGKAYASINQALNDNKVKGFEQATGELVKLQTSENSTLKAIGKAAAIAQITIDTARSAMSIYTGFATIPYVGIPLGIAGAAAAVAFGGFQIAKVLGANQGGIVPGMGPNRDSVPSMLTPGELVVPRQNFDEVINAVTQSRESGMSTRGGGAPTGGSVMISFSSEEAARVITAQDVENDSLGISRRVG